MDPFRLTGFVYPVKKNGVPVRGRWQLWVNLPSEPAFDKDGQPVLDSKGRQKQRYPKTTKVVEAKGKKAAERLLETWISELEAHRTIDPDRLKLAELLDRWLEATRGEMRVASYNSYKRIRRLHVDPALGQVHAAGVLAGFSGLRVGEISGLRWSDIDLERCFFNVQRTIEEDDDGTLLE